MVGDGSSSDKESDMQYLHIPKGSQNSRHFTSCQGLCIVDQNEWICSSMNKVWNNFKSTE